MSGVHLFWLAPALPMLTFTLLAAGLGRRRRIATGLSCVALAGSVVVSLLTLPAAMQGVDAVARVPWFKAGELQLELTLKLDLLGAAAATAASFVGLAVFVYAARSLAGQLCLGCFFAGLNLLTGSMLLLVLAADLLTLFIAWALLAVAAYLLIGFWFERPDVPHVATQAFFIARLGDLLMLDGFLHLAHALGSSRMDIVLAAVSAAEVDSRLLLENALLIFAGVATRAAQVPFQGWLPDVMARPAPISAVLSPASLVVAGVFLFIRLYPLFAAAAPALFIVGGVGIATILVAAVAAPADPKRVLAYSLVGLSGLVFTAFAFGPLMVESVAVQVLALATTVFIIGISIWAWRTRSAARFISGFKALYRALPQWVLTTVSAVSRFDQGVFDRIDHHSVRGVYRVIGVACRFDRSVFDATAAKVATATLSVIHAGARFDRSVFDATAAKVATATLSVIHAGARFDLRRLEATVIAFSEALLAASQRLRGLQTGRIENYLLMAFLWISGIVTLAVLATFMS